MMLRKAYIQTELLEASGKGQLKECLKKLENLINIEEKEEIDRRKEENGKD